MFNLREYRYDRKKSRLSDRLPWCRLLDDNGLLLNKDGSMQKTYRFRGMDLDSATREELISAVKKINNIFKRMGSGWTIYSDSIRFKDRKFRKSNYPDAVCQMIEDEREQFFSSGENYQSEYFMTFCWLPPQDMQEKIFELFLKKGSLEQYLEKEEHKYNLHIKHFKIECERIHNLIKEGMSELEALTSEETITYLHSCISPKKHIVKVPEVPMYLDAFLVDTPFLAGLAPMMGKYHLRTITLLGYPGKSTPGLLDKLNRLNIEYRWTNRFICQDKRDAGDELKIYQRNWFSKRKSALSLLGEVFSNRESPIQDTDALNKATDSEMAAEAVAGDFVSFGYFSMTITVMDKNLQQLEKKIRAIEKTINGVGFNTILEGQNSFEAWLGSLPGIVRANVRRALVSSANFAHIFQLSAVWSGENYNKHIYKYLKDRQGMEYKAPALMQTITTGNTPFRLNLHVGDVGHTLIVGPTGAGKSVLLATIAAQFRKYNDAQVYFFDKGGSSRVLTYGIGGDFYDLAVEEGGAVSFQPLAEIAVEADRKWASEWLEAYFENEKVEITPDRRDKIRVALESLAKSPKEQRTIGGFSLLVQDKELRQAVSPMCWGGTFGSLMDSSEDKLSYGRWQVFEMDELMNFKSIVPSALTYLFYKLDKRFTGKPTLLIMDESWRYVEHPIFAEQIRTWLKELRKKNVSVVFATQSLADIYNSTIVSAILDNCFTRIFLPNSNAMDARMSEMYYSFGLNKREIEIISEAGRKREYYYKAVGLDGKGYGSRKFELALGEVALSYFATSDKSEQEVAMEIKRKYGNKFNEEWLKHKRLGHLVNDYRALNEFLRA